MFVLSSRSTFFSFAKTTLFMKQNRWVGLILAVLFIALTAMQTRSVDSLPFTENKLKIELAEHSDLRLKLQCVNETGKKVRISVVRKEDSIFGYHSESTVYEEYVAAEQTSFNKLLNLSQLENGDYYVEITGGKERFVRHIKIQDVVEKENKPRKIVF